MSHREATSYCRPYRKKKKDAELPQSQLWSGDLPMTQKVRMVTWFQRQAIEQVRTSTTMPPSWRRLYLQQSMLDFTLYSLTLFPPSSTPTNSLPIHKGVKWVEAPVVKFDHMYTPFIKLREVMPSKIHGAFPSFSSILLFVYFCLKAQTASLDMCLQTVVYFIQNVLNNETKKLWT